MIIPTNELIAASESDNSGVPVFGYAQVDEALRLILNLGYQELRQFAERLEAANPAQVDRLLDTLITATTGEVTPEESRARVGRILHSVITQKCGV